MGREEQIEEREVLDSIFPEEIKSMYAIAEAYGVYTIYERMAGSWGSPIVLSCRWGSQFVTCGFKEGFRTSNVYDYHKHLLT